LSARRRRAGAGRGRIRNRPSRRRGGRNPRRVCGDLRGFWRAHSAAARDQPRDDRQRAARPRPLADDNPLGRTRPDAAGLLFDAVKGVNFRIRPAATVALVGESGSGKSVVSQSILRILPRNGRIVRGAIRFADPRGNGEVVDLVQLPADGAAMRAIRGGRISIIFQEPMSSLSPLHTIGDQVGEALKLHRSVSAAEAKELTTDMLRLVGFPDPERAWRSYAFEL